MDAADESDIVYELSRPTRSISAAREVRVLTIFSATGSAYAGIVPVHSPLAGGIRDTHLAPAYSLFFTKYA